jgi:hypothetical protein
MAEVMKTKLPQKLLILALLLGCLGFLATAEPAMAGYTGCVGEIHIIEVQNCYWWDYAQWFCTTDRYACVQCNEGTPCYYLYNN